jgi:type IX secretion system PorP/SprF family membrane protein
MKKLVLTVTLCAGALLAHAQQQPLYTQYMFNGLALNPAYAGSQDALDLTVLTRWQWAGIDGAPDTRTFAAHSPVTDKAALGLLVMNDEIGVSNRWSAYASYAYRIPVGKGRLALGLQAGFDSYSSDLAQLTFRGADPGVASNVTSGALFNAGAGLFYHTERFYLGASVPQILNNDYYENLDGSVARQYRHYFVTAGYVIDAGPSLKLKPNVLVRAVPGAPVGYDLNLNLLIREVLWIGGSYRSQDAVSGLLEILLTDQLRLGYAYDYTISDLQDFNNGSHELMLNYRFAFGKSKVLSPRYF